MGREGFRTSAVATLREALGALRRAPGLAPAHLLVTSYASALGPATDGPHRHDGLASLRRASPTTPALVIASAADAETRRRVRRHGALCLEKPFGFEELARLAGALVGSPGVRHPTERPRSASGGA